MCTVCAVYYKLYAKPHTDKGKNFALLFRVAVAREAQQVAMEQELLESLPLLYKNKSEQVTMDLECKGKGGQPCQGPAHMTVTVLILRLHMVHLIIFRSVKSAGCGLLFNVCLSLHSQCERVQRQEAMQTQITSVRRDIKKLQTDSMAAPPQTLAQAAVHTENFIT